MLGIAFKKFFFDVWDNLTAVLLTNFAFTVATLLCALTVVVVPSFFLAPVYVVLLVALASIPNALSHSIVHSGSFLWTEIFYRAKSTWLRWVFTFVLPLGLFAGILWGLPFYFQWNFWAGICVSVVLVWSVIFFVCLGIFFPGILAAPSVSVESLFRQSFLLFAAQPLVTVMFVFITIAAVALSVVTLGFFPGIVGIFIWLQIAHRFLTAKLVWIREQPKSSRLRVPWKSILTEDLEKMENRTWKNLIFPWKD